MNLREIKKDIEYVLSAFVEDCSVFAAINPAAADGPVADLMEEAIDVYNELKDKVNVKGIEGSKKVYFNNLRKEVLEKTDALYEKLSSAVKASVEGKPEEKPAAKKPAAKKPAAKKPAAKKEAEAPAEAEKPAAKKPAAKKPAAEKKPAAAKKPAAEKAPAAKKPAAKKPAAKKAEPKAE